MTRSRATLTCVYLLYFIHLIHCSVIVVVDEDLPQSKVPPALSTQKVSAVKRIVPHGYKTPQFEYDRKYGTVFVPKYRVHKTRPAKNRKVLGQIYKLLFRPMKLNKDQSINAILKALGKQNGRYNLRTTEEMDSKLYDPSHIQSNRPAEVLIDPDVERKKDLIYNFPHFSIFNYWSYDKSLFQDRCPLNQAKLGRYCIYAPHIIT